MPLTSQPISADPGEKSLIDKYRNYYRERELFVEVPPAHPAPWQHLRMEVPFGKGRGWMERIEISRGLSVGLCDYHVDDYFEDEVADIGVALGFEIMLSGYFELSNPGSDRCTSIRGGELWLRRGGTGHLRYRQRPDSAMRGVGIELPNDMVDAWLDGAPDPLARALENLMRGRGAGCNLSTEACLLAYFDRRRSEIGEDAVRLLATSRDTFFGQLQFESRTLDFLTRLLSMEYCPDKIEPRGRARHQAAIDEAVDILRSEWADPPTIAALARRVGINECYLKAQFRRYTGLSVGEFVRKLRMERALELIESGNHSVLETAFCVGYSNPSHFSAAFKRFYGRLPSFYLTKN
ncbi:AraC family transcriptional regulator [uncultured Desulfuromonas sp.]|uniref:helix-turn-helix transcriptional regulator n=1 Tax=uncultured Desulfuromonas sp. TaxID=181013 RepID=UPI002AAB6C18|nr:AraC family transcriptional regulator [uncultured Desulfuromonas sp.]